MRLTAPSSTWSDASTRVADSGIDPLTTLFEERSTMTTETHITAGPLAAAGARLGAASLAACPGSTTLASYASAVHPVSSGHPTSTWTQGAIAKPATFMVFDRKNRPTRPLSELSP
jgi:hypothetical protein